MEKSAARKRLLIYLGLVFTLTYLYEFLVVIPAVTKPGASGMWPTLLTGTVMLVPALSVLLTRLITREGFKDAWIKPHLNRRWRYYVAAWLAPPIFTVIGCALYFLLFPQNYDGELSYFSSILAQSGQTLEGSMLWVMILASLAQSIVLAPVLNIITCFGEEWGWRGYMMPKFLESGVKIIPSLLVGGVLWGLWHAPLTWGIGHNYGMGYAGYPWTGILAMCGMCLALGTFFTFLSLRARSCLPAVLAHGAFNGIAPLGIYLTTGEYNPFIGPMPTGIIGGLALLITAVALALIMARDEKRGELIYEPAAEAPAPVAPINIDPDNPFGGKRA